MSEEINVTMNWVKLSQAQEEKIAAQYRFIQQLQDDLTNLSGKTGFCAQCEAYARENERLREALEKINKMQIPDLDKNMTMRTAQLGGLLAVCFGIAKSALEGKKCQ